MRVLVSGFGPFGEVRENVSAQVLPLLLSRAPQACEITTVELPVRFGEAAPTLLEYLRTGRWDCVVALGVAERRTAVTPELVALNHVHARIPDRDGRQPHDTPIRAGAPFAYRATLPVYRIADALNATGIPAEVSYSAGAYVCNHLMYELLHELAAHGSSGTRAGFVHLPGRTQLSVGDLAGAVVAAIEVCRDAEVRPSAH